MSGTANQIPPIPIRFEGAENVQRTIDAIVARIGSLETAARSASVGGLGALRTQAEQTGGAFRNAGQLIGQAGYQVQDFAVQVASGQSALTAFVQQGSQLASLFGPTGILVGAGLAIGGIATQFFRVGESAEDAQRRIEAANTAATRGANLYRDAMDQLTAAILRNADAERQRAAARGLAEASAAAQTSIDADRSTLATVQARLGVLRNEGTADQLAEYERLHGVGASLDVRNSGALRINEYRALLRQEATLQESIQRMQRARIVTLTPDPRGDESGADRGDWWAARNEYLRQQGAADAEELGGVYGLIQNQYRDYVGTLSPSGGGGSGSARDPRQYGPLDGSVQGLAQLERGRIRAMEEEARARDRLAQEEQRDLERREAANARTTDRIVSYASDSFATLFDENSRGWDGMWETFESTAKRTVARIAAELVLRPIVEPIVSGLGLGGSGSGTGGSGGSIISSLFGGNVMSGGSSVPRSMLGSTGGASSGGGFLSQIGGIISNPIYQEGFGFFQPNASGAINAASSAAPWLIPSMPTSGGALANIGSVSLGNYAAGIGGGYMIGSQLGGFIAKTDAQRLNSQIGAGGGAAAGALIGAAVGGPFAPITAVIGGLIGGAAGGAGGGLLGPSSAFRGGDVQIGIVNGQLAIVGSGGKRWDAGAARSQSQAGLDSLNQALASAGVSIGQSGAIGWQGYGGSKNVLGPTEIWNATHNNLATSNPTLQAALGQSWMQSFEDLSFVAPYAAQNDNLTRALGSGGIRSRVDFNAASEFITGTYEPMVKAASITDTFAEAVNNLAKQFNDAIGRSQELGLATDALTAKRDKELAAVVKQRDTAVSDALASLRIDELTAAGDTKGAAWASYSLSSAQRLRQAQGFLTQNGYGEGTDLYAQTTARLMALFDKERTNLAASLTPAANDTGANSGTALLQDLFVGDLGGASAASRYAFGLTTLGNLRKAGDLDDYTAFASRFLSGTARPYLGTSERYGALVGQIRRDTVSLGGDPTGMLVDAQTRSADGIENLVRQTAAQKDEIVALRRELSRFAAQVVTLQARQPKAA